MKSHSYYLQGCGRIEMATAFSSSFVMESSLLPKQNKLINVCGLKYRGILSAAAFRLVDLTTKGGAFCAAHM